MLISESLKRAPDGLALVPGFAANSYGRLLVSGRLGAFCKLWPLLVQNEEATIIGFASLR